MSVTYGLHRWALLERNAPALMFEDRKRTWFELKERVARLAGGLREIGIRRGDRVAVLSLNQDRYFELYLAVAWAAAVIVPLNIRWSALENEDALSDSRASLLVVDSAFARMGATISARIEGVRLIYADDAPRPEGLETALDYEAQLAAAAPIADAEAAETELAGVFYTGGTTGRSKGVMLSHRTLLANARNCALMAPSADNSVYLHCAPMFHLADVSAMQTHLLLGSAHAIMRMFTPEGVARAIARFAVTDVLLVPTMIQMFVDQPGFNQQDLSSLRRVVYGASPISEAVLDRAIARLPDVEFVQAYGMTELSPCATHLPWRDHLGEGRAKGRHRSAGRPIPMVEVKVVDPLGVAVAPGVVGEIVARGDVVMMGYWERPEETSKAIRDGWMHTGDGGYMDEDGYVYIVDRIKDMIISGGENIYSAEVENCVAKHPAVTQCAVIGIPSERWGEAVHAVVMRKPGAVVTEDEIIAFCKERIAGYKCPRSVHVQDEMLPLSGAGKILKRELRRPYWENRSRAVS